MIVLRVIKFSFALFTLGFFFFNQMAWSATQLDASNSANSATVDATATNSSGTAAVVPPPAVASDEYPLSAPLTMPSVALVLEADGMQLIGGFIGGASYELAEKALVIEIMSDRSVNAIRGISNYGNLNGIKGVYDPGNNTIVIDTSVPDQQITDKTTIQIVQNGTGGYVIQSMEQVWKDYANNSARNVSYMKTTTRYENGSLKSTDSESVFKSTTVSRQHQKMHTDYETFIIDGVKKCRMTFSSAEESRPARGGRNVWPIDPVTDEPDVSFNYYVANEFKAFHEYDNQGNLIRSVVIDNQIDLGLWRATTQEMSADGALIINSTEVDVLGGNSDLFDKILSVDSLNILKDAIQTSNSYYKVIDNTPPLATAPVTPTIPVTAVSETSNQLPVQGSTPTGTTKTSESVFDKPKEESKATEVYKPEDPIIFKSVPISLEPITPTINPMPVGSNPGTENLAKSTGLPPVRELPREIKKGIDPIIKELNIENKDKQMLVEDLGRFTDLLIHMPNTRDLSSVEFKTYLKYLSDAIARLVALAEKYKDDEGVQKAIQTALLNIVEHLLRASQINHMDLSKVESDLELFQELIKQQTGNSILSPEETQILDQNIDATLEILRQGATQKNTPALRREIYKKWYFLLAKRTRVMRLRRVVDLRQGPQNELESSNQFASNKL